jgi:urocanate hydratase
MRKLNLYYGTVKSAANRQHFMAWANSREQALDMVEAALTATEPVLGSVVGPIASLPADVMKPGVFVEVMAAPEG